MKVYKLNAFTDEWNFNFVYCPSDKAKKLVKDLFPDVEYDFNVRAATFYRNDKEPLIWINSDKVETRQQKFYTAVHESYHLIYHLGEYLNIKDEEWFAEMLEYVSKQIIKILKSLIK